MSDFRSYNDPIGGSQSSHDLPGGEQIVQEAYWRKAITLAMRDMYFMPLAEVKDMPRNSGKTMKANVYVPVLDDENLSDEGIDASGQILDAASFYAFVDGSVASIGWTGAAADGGYTSAALVLAAPEWVDEVVTSGVSNLYGSSRDSGTITAKLPLLTEGAARVNRVGASRQQVVGSIEQFGFFNEYTEDSLMFDTDAELQMHITTEMLHAATEITEDTLQKDLINSAAVIRLPGTALTKAGITVTDFISYNDFVRLSIQLDLNRTPKHTTIITGSRMIDTKTVNSARFMYVAPEQVPELEALQNYHNDKAMIDVRHYEGQTTTMNGEIGTIHNFRIIVNPEMQVDSGAGGADAGDHYETGGQLDLYPMLTVGEDSFSTIGFMSDGKKRNTKFTIHHLRPGGGSVTRENPYGNMGLMSIRWWYGFLLKRSERIGLMWAAVRLNPTP